MKMISTLVLGISLISSALAQTTADAAKSTCPLSTVTIPACPTVTKTGTGIINCPLETPCIHPDCIILSTITEGCVGKCCPSKTPTVTVKPTCPTCNHGCGTSYTTVTEGC